MLRMLLRYCILDIAFSPVFFISLTALIHSIPPAFFSFFCSLILLPYSIVLLFPAIFVLS